MNILFLTIGEYASVRQHGIYPDLMRCFMNHGHRVYVVCMGGKHQKRRAELYEEGRAKAVKVRAGGREGLLAKGLSMLLAEKQYKHAIDKFYGNIRFGLVLYSTPPITLASVVGYVKKRDGADTYLLLKDIFPQNAVDIGLMEKKGIKGLAYRYFRRMEKRLYRISDRIGCMSQANVSYVQKHNPQIGLEKLEICPNALEPADMTVNPEMRRQVRRKYGIPQDKIVFVHGGNLGKPQGVDFLMKCLYSQRDRREAFFLIIGSGTEYERLERFAAAYARRNVKLIRWLAKEEYDAMAGACDVGLVFLDHRFTIPNFPSRMLSYMQAKMPVLACTDPNTDIGRVIMDGKFGWWCESNDVRAFHRLVGDICRSGVPESFRENAFAYAQKHYHVERAYRVIMDGRKGRRE